jgi:hypothetical protein
MTYRGAPHERLLHAALALHLLRARLAATGAALRRLLPRGGVERGAPAAALAAMSDFPASDLNSKATWFLGFNKTNQQLLLSIK